MIFTRNTLDELPELDICGCRNVVNDTSYTTIVEQSVVPLKTLSVVLSKTKARLFEKGKADAATCINKTVS